MGKSSGGTRNIDKTHNPSGIINGKIDYDDLKKYSGQEQSYAAKLMGVDGKPKVMTASEFDALDKRDYIILHRGFGRTDNDAAYLDAFVNGDYRNGRNIDNTQGVHFITNETVANTYGGGRNVLTIALPKSGLKVAQGDRPIQAYERDYARATERYRKFDKAGDRENARKAYAQVRAIKDYGSWATYKGYDAIKTNDEGGGTYILLARNKVIIKR